MKRILIIIPAYNEEATISEVLKGIPRRIKDIRADLLVIDDGSTDRTRYIAEKITQVITHPLNRGLGASLSTGFSYAKLKNYDYVVTFDADGQHNSQDIPSLIEPLIKGNADVVIGSRLIVAGQMPVVRRTINWLSNIFTWLLFTVWTTDSQSGLRAFSKKTIHDLKIRSQRMEVSSEIFKEIKRLHLKFTEIPVTPIYTPYSLRKGQQVTNAPNILWKLIINHLA